MKKLFAVIFFIQIIFISAWGALVLPAMSMENAVWIDQQTGIRVDQRDPVNTVIAYYSLINKKSFEAAHKLLTPAGEKLMTPEVLKKINSRVILKETEIIKFYKPKMVGDKFAIVGNIRTIGKEGAALVGITILKLGNNGWEITTSGDFKNLGKDILVSLFDNSIAVAKEISTDTSLKLSKLQKEQVTRQALSMETTLVKSKSKI